MSGEEDKKPAEASAAAAEAKATLPHPAPEGVTIYYWPGSLLLLAPSLLLDRPTGPLSATLRIACRESYTIEVDGKQLQTRASLVAPKAERKRIAAINSEIALFYLPLGLQESPGMKALLDGRSLVDLPIERFADELPLIRQAMREVMPGETIKALMQRVVARLTGESETAPPPLHPRVLAAQQVLDALPLNEVSLQRVAAEVHLSTSRLRALFKEQTGFTIGDYARWRAVWRAALLWKRGLKFTDVAIEAGFHDLAHLDRTFNQVFGMNPSKVIDPQYVTLVNCE